MMKEIDETIALLQELKAAAEKCPNPAVVEEANYEIKTYKGAIRYYIRACNYRVEK